MLPHECELFYLLAENIECLIQQTLANHPVFFPAMLNMGDHAYTLFSIERHTVAVIKQPVELHQVLTDIAAVWPAKILWAYSNGHLG